MKKALLSLIVLFFVITKSIAQADCSNPIIICGNTGTFNPSGVGNKLEQLACGGIEHNSVWFAFQAKANGKLNFVIRPYTLAGLPLVIDVDWSLYKLAGTPNSSNCNTKTQLSCNFAGSSTVFGIPGATGLATPPFTASQFNPGIDVTTGTWYALHIDQFSNTTPTLLSVQFTDNPEFNALNSTAAIFDNRPNFTINTSSGCNGIYSFTNSSTATAGIASYLWDFGDGSSSTLAAPSKTFATPGTYYVTQRVTDNNGCASNIKKAVIYNNTPPTLTVASILATPSCSDANNGTITVTNTGTTTPGVTGGTPPYTYELVSPSPMIRASQSSNQFTGLQPGGYYAKVTDACGKSAISTVITISQVATNSLIGLGIQNIQAACNNTATGTATIFANGTTPPYTLALVNSSPVTTAALPAIARDPITATYYTTFTNLLPGLYTVEATDACGKVRRATFTVTVSIAPTATTVASPSCAGSPTGTLTVTATGSNGLSANGSPGTFQYALISPSPILRSFQNSSVFENLVPGTYTISVKDNCGNLGTTTATVGTAVAPNFGTSFTTTSCPNGSTGTIEVQNGTTAGGGSPYTYQLIEPSPVLRAEQSSNLFSNLPPGTYTVRLKDVCGTSAITTVTVAAATAPTFTTAVTNSCTSPASGTLTVTPGASSIGAYTFELISPGAAIRTPQGSNIANTFNSIFTGLSQGLYTIRMTDGCGVPVTGTATVAAPTALAFPTGSIAVASCASPSSGQITVAQPTTGLGAYKYELIAPSPVTRAPQYSRIFNGLPPGNYTIRITDSCGTQVDNSATPLNLPTATAPTLTVTNTASCTTASGTITCIATTANQGGGTYQFALISPSPVTRVNQASPIFTGLPAGAYTIQITDQCGQTGTTTTTIAAAGAFTPAAGASIASCNGSGYYSQIIVTTPQNYTPGGPIPTGSGGGPYTFAIYDATNTTLIAGPQSSNVFSTITPLAGAPTHTIRVTDACGNTSTTTLTVSPPATMLAATISATTPSCASSNTGVIKVTVGSSGGLPPYRYALIDAVTSNVVLSDQTFTTFNNVPANATGYLVRTTDACGNTITSSTALLFPAAVAPTASVVTTASCVSPSSGSIVVTPGTGSTFAGGTFSYSLYDAGNITLIRATQASPVFANLATATYTVRVTDVCGTVGTAAATVSGTVAIPTASGTATATCAGGNTGSIRGASTGGSSPISFSLVNQVTSAVIAGPQADSIFTGLAAGTYIVRVTDACGTVVNSANIVLGDFVTTPTLSTTLALDCGGTAIISGYGGGGNGGPFTYALCSGSGCTSFGTYSTTSTFNITSSNTYRISVKDRCDNATSSADIVVTIPAKPTITGVSKANACGSTTINVTYTGVPNTPYYSLDGGNFSPTIGTLSSGSHTIRVSDYNTGVFGCASDPFTVNVDPPGIWLGISADATDANNWCGGLPTSTTDISISTGVPFQPVLSSGSLAVKSITLNSGSSFTVNNGTTLQVNGNIINNGNGISGTGGLTVASNSTISGTAISFNGTLTVNSGAVLTTGGLLTLTSNASNTARVATGSSSGGYISGLVKVERYIPGSYRKFRFLGHPFATAMNVTELTDDIDITGSITGSNANGFTATTTNNPSAFTFTEANGNNALNDAGWTAITSGNSVSTIAQGQGIRILVRGTKGQTGSLTGGVYTPNAVTLSLNGTLKQGDFTQNLNYTSASKGWNLVSNPYTSNINWSTVTRTNVNNAVYVYRPSTSAYASWINGSSTNGGSNIIESGNAFFVQANAASPSLGWHETDKVATAQPATMFRETSVITNRLSLSLVQEATQTSDEVVVRFGDDAATDLFDSKYDAKNIVASSHDLYVLDQQSTQYSIYHGSALKNEAIENREVALGFTVGTLGTYSIKAKVLNAITGGNKAFIKDAFANTLTELTDNTSYTFEVTADTKTQEEGRFSIVFNPKDKSMLVIEQLSIKLSPNPAKGIVTLAYTQTSELNTKVVIINAAGKKVQTINLGKVQSGTRKIDISHLSSGVYFVHYDNGEETKTEKLIIK